MNILFWTFFAFSAGSLPFSVWVGKLALRTDIRRYGDNNPGATNVMRAGSKAWAALALLLDMLKGGLPVGLAWYWAGLSDWALVPVALAPIAGHAFSPFLGFNGGKALAVTLGVWGGLTFGVAPVIIGLLAAFWFAVVSKEAWAVMLAAFSFLLVLLAFNSQGYLLAIWAGNSLIVAWKHRDDLHRLPAVRPWLRKWVSQ